MPKEVYHSQLSTFVNMRCVDCYRDCLADEDSANGGGFIEDARFLIGGDGVCRKHARERLAPGPTVAEQIDQMIKNAKKKKGK